MSIVDDSRPVLFRISRNFVPRQPKSKGANFIRIMSSAISSLDILLSRNIFHCFESNIFFNYGIKFVFNRFSDITVVTDRYKFVYV